jgi:cobalt-precorrin-5B (C1)-methyltransferase
MGDFVGGMLKYLRRHPIPRVTIAGGLGKMTKLAQGMLDLHSKRGEVDLAFLAKLAEAARATPELSRRIVGSNTALEAFAEAKAAGIALGDRVAERARQTAVQVVAGSPIELEVILFDREGEIAGRAGALQPSTSGLDS